MTRPSLFPALGVVAALTGVAAGTLVASLTDPAASPVLAVGSQVIDLTPTPVKEWAVARFGTADKPLLVGSVLLGTLVVAAIAGVISEHRPRRGAALIALLAVGVGVLTVLRPGAGAAAPVPGLATGVVAVGTLLFLRSRALTPTASGAGPTRRTILTAGGFLVLAAALGGAASRIIGLRTQPQDVTLPRPTSAAPALPAGLDVPGITPFRTPTKDFYRVDTRLSLPLVDLDAWRLQIDGDVGRPVTLTFDQLLDMRMIERDITLTCVSNDVGGRYVGGARWLGVPLQDVLDLSDVSATRADQILSTDVDGMTISTPLDLALDGRDAMIAVGMNGEPLPRKHGFPARLVIPGLYGFISATKWITRLTLTTYADQDAYWTERGWATDAPIKIASRIDTPKAFQTVKAGEVVVGGVAWAQHQGGIERVEVSIDGGPWQDAELGPSGGQDYWRQWAFRWDAPRGDHEVASRATTGEGDRQTTKRSSPFPDGSSGIQRVVVTVD